MSLSRQEVAKVGLLARLALSETDLDRMTGELTKIVGFVSQLEELDTSAVAPLAHPLDTQNVFRDDVPAASLRGEARRVRGRPGRRVRGLLDRARRIPPAPGLRRRPGGPGRVHRAGRDASGVG